MTTPTTRLGFAVCLLVWTLACNATSREGAPCAQGFDADGGITASTSDDPPVSPGPKRVFVTTRQYAGDLMAVGHTENGALAADVICQQAAEEVGLDGHWKAWVSTSFENAIDRIHGTGPFVRLDGVVVAETHDDLRGELLAPISVNQRGYSVCDEGSYSQERIVWTGTRVGGTWDIDNCLDWTSDDDTDHGVQGSVCATEHWTFSDNDYRCDEPRSFYCFEQ